MNPPSAIHNAMSRDRKPFTYTPGGLDLSEIKSERMAKRIMRNAMNPGLPEMPANSIQSPPMPSSPVIVPNFNCLPVQVFPTFNLPANPKSLLRTRSIPDQPREARGQRAALSQYDDSSKANIGNSETTNNGVSSYHQVNKNNRPASMYEYSSLPINYISEPTTNCSNADHKELRLPEISYDAEYLTMPPKINQAVIIDKNQNPETIQNNEKQLRENINTIIDVPVTLLSDTRLNNSHPIKQPLEDETGNIKQREEKVKKTVKKEQRTEQHNGNIEAELTVKLPTKKIGPKIETKVEVERKILPDGKVEEVKTTTTTTTIDGKADVKTEKETRILSDEEAALVVEVVEEEEEEEEEQEEEIIEEAEDKNKNKQTVKQQEKDVKKSNEVATVKENTRKENVTRTQERSETTTTTSKKVVVVQSDDEEVDEEIEEEEIVEEEEVEETEPVTTVSIKKSEKLSTPPPDVTENKVGDDEAEVGEEKTPHVDEDTVSTKEEEIEEIKVNLKDEDVVEEELEKQEESATMVQEEPSTEKQEDEDKEQFEEALEAGVEKDKNLENETEKQEEQNYIKNETKEVSDMVSEAEIVDKEDTAEKVVEQIPESKNDEINVLKDEPEKLPVTETKIPLREPSIPLDKIDDIEIKPIGPAGVITKTHTEKTEIVTSSIDQPPGVHSTQTEYNRIENIVTVNRTTKTLDHAYDNLPQQEIPTVKTYFTPSRVLSSPMPSSPYQPVYTPVSTERRHSLLLDRLSVDRQMPSEIYQNQGYEQQRQMSQEPQSEVLTISNVKPSKITNQQWYQQSKETVHSSTTPIAAENQTWSQPESKVQPQPTYKPQPKYPPSQSYQPPQSYQSQQQPYQSQPSYQPQQTYQPQQSYQPQQTYPSQQNYPSQPTPQPQFQPSYIEPVQTNKYSTFTPKSVNRVSNLDTTASSNISSNLYSFNKDASETYHQSTQQYSSSYVPPPWEQDSSYIADYNQNYYPPATGTLNPTSTPAQSWKPTPPKGKFSKPPPTAYIPPAPNQSFVKSVSNSEPPKQLGRKTYYSEYERRYITVPESTYIPHDTKFQPQPDPSPKYYYDNNETNETVEHQWRKELREFTEKTSQPQTQTEQASVKPPWESDPKYAKTDLTYTSTPTWSQTVRPRSWRERSFESEYVGSQEWPKTNTLGRGRPLTSYSKNEPILERTRGVSVDRYNPNSYQPPTTLEHPPVQTHTLPTPAPHGTYHNPNVPAYHSRASDELREQQQPSYKQPRVIREQRASPFQSRSFKYLQWITGTED